MSAVFLESIFYLVLCSLSVSLWTQTTMFKVTLKKCDDCFKYILVILNDCEVNLKYIRHFNNFEDHIFEIKFKNCCCLLNTLT